VARVLVIEGDKLLASTLARVLGDAGFEVHVAPNARDGFARACELVPECIVCAARLPDVDGYWVARRVRTERSEVATTPFLFLTGVHDAGARLEALNVGADAYLSRPFRNDELVAQVGALIDMAKRLRQKRDSFFSSPPSSRQSPAFRGDIAQLSVSTLLSMLELERRTGRLKVRTVGASAEFELVAGTLVRARLVGQAHAPVDALRQVLGWKVGRFWFRPGAGTTPAQSVRGSIGALLLEAMRLEDESEK
jgi:two-component system, OmpR family, response regulator